MARFALILVFVTISVFRNDLKSAFGWSDDYIAEGVSDEKDCLDNGDCVQREEDGTRVKRYPEHLDPNFIFGWNRIEECPESEDGIHKHFCPTPTTSQKWVCIDDYQLCDGIKNCPNAEDESSLYCMFYRALKSNMELLATSVSNLNDKNGNPIQDTGKKYEVEIAEENFVPNYHRQRGRFKPAN